MSDDVISFRINGLKELQALLNKFPVDFEAKVARGGLRAGMKVVLPVAQKNIHSVSGELAESLTINTRKGKDGKVRATVGTKKFYGKFVEYGTRPHLIAAHEGKAIQIGQSFYSAVWHSGSAPHPFLRPALDTQARAAVVAMGNKIKARLEKTGLDLSGLEIEGGDEP